VDGEIVFLHLSDTHFLAGDGDLLGMNPARSLRRVLGHIDALPIAPRFCLLTGDLVQDSRAESYAHLRAALAPLEARGVALLPCLGNHDDRAAFRRGFLGEGGDDGSPTYRTVERDGLRIVLLDSLVPGTDRGELGTAQLAWLVGELAQSGDTPTIVALHHPVTLAAMPWLDADLLRDAGALRDLLIGRPVLGVLAGHCHAASATAFAGTLAATAPAVAFAARVGVPQMELSDRSGFALCTARRDSLIVTPIMV
jgi:3',5'-cyclic-AMP phosphodiesterase